MRYLSPGVYFEEFAAGTNPDTGGFARGTATRSAFELPITRSRWLDPRLTAAFVGFADRGPVNAPAYITSWQEYVSYFGGFVEGAFLGHAMYGFFQNGGQSAYVVRAGAQGSLSRYAEVAVPSATDPRTSALRIVARSPGPAGNALAVEVLPSEDPSGFDLVVTRAGEAVEQFQGLEVEPNQSNAGVAVNDLSLLVAVAGPEPLAPPAIGRYPLIGGSFQGPSDTVTSRSDGVDVHHTAIDALTELAERVQVVAAPDIMSLYAGGEIGVETVLSNQHALIAHCEHMGDRIAVLDVPPGLNASMVREWRTEVARYDSSSAAMYYPWIGVSDPSTDGRITVPPCGHVAGVCARTVAGEGFRRSPANEALIGAVTVERSLFRAEVDLLNPEGINTIVSPAGSAPIVWGARTLSSDPTWRLVRTRLVANFVAGNITAAMRWVIHRPGGPALWAEVTRELRGFFDLLLLSGALAGVSAEAAYSVKCDEDTNPAEALSAGLTKAECALNLDGGSTLMFRVVFASI